MITPWLQPLPLIAILRGLTPPEAVAVGEAIAGAGLRMLEVPLKSPQPRQSIRLLRQHFGERCLIGAGTVLTPAQVDAVADAGGQLIVMPHADTAVIAAAKRVGLICTPGVATATEAFAALAAGADALKIFPAEQVGPAVIRAWRAVLPRELTLLPVGGINPDNMAAYVVAGAGGFGIGSALYAPGRDPVEVGLRARAFARTWTSLQHGASA